jgi:polyisoprenoid-binding protein YceI
MTDATLVSEILGLPPGDWRPAPGAGHVGFEVKTMWGLATVKGHFDRYDGVFRIEADSASAELTIDSSSVDTGNAKRDDHLRSADFFHADEHEAVTFRSQAITVIPGGLLVGGDLTVGTTTVPLELTVDVKQNDTGSLVLSTQTAVPREVANLTWNKMGMIRGDALLKVELVLLRDE